jgi:Ca2+-binding EF-hand superfamily protein
MFEVPVESAANDGIPFVSRFSKRDLLEYPEKYRLLFFVLKNIADEEKLHRPLQILVAIANAVSQGNFRSSEPRTSDSEMKMAIPLLRLSKERIAELQEFHLSKFGSLETKIPFSEISLSLMELGYYVPDDKLEELEKSLGYGVTDLTHSQFVALFQRVAFFETSAVDRAKIPLFFRRYDNDHFTVGLNELYSMIEDIHAGHFSREDVFRTLELWCEEKRQHELDFSEFCSMLAYASALANIEHLDPEFKKFSSDGEKITLQDLVTALERYCGVTLTRNEAEDMIAEADVDGKGFVSLQDFVNLCKRVYNPDEIAFWEWRSKSPHVHKKSLVY